MAMCFPKGRNYTLDYIILDRTAFICSEMLCSIFCTNKPLGLFLFSEENPKSNDRIFTIADSQNSDQSLCTCPMGACRHGQGGTCSPPQCCRLQSFCTLVLVTVKGLGDKLFLLYFHNLSLASGGFAPRPPPGLHLWTPLGDFRPQTHSLPTPGKNPAGAHDMSMSYIDN